MKTPDASKRLLETDTFILDLDGTVYLSDTVLPGAREFVDFLAHSGRRYVFITNNSSRTAAERVAEGFRLVLVASDVTELMRGAAQDLADVRQSLR